VGSLSQFMDDYIKSKELEYSSDEKSQLTDHFGTLINQVKTIKTNSAALNPLISNDNLYKRMVKKILHTN